MGFNLKAVQSNNSGTFESLPEGEYPVVITEATPSESKTSKNPLIKLKLRVMEGQYKNRVVFDNLTFTEKAMFRVKNLLDCTNSELAESENAEIGEIAEDLVGREMKVFLEPETNSNGKPGNKVKGFRPMKPKDDLAVLDKPRPAAAPAKKSLLS